MTPNNRKLDDERPKLVDELDVDLSSNVNEVRLFVEHEPTETLVVNDTATTFTTAGSPETVEYEFADGDLNRVGPHRYEWVVERTGGDVESFPKDKSGFRLDVADQVNRSGPVSKASAGVAGPLDEILFNESGSTPQTPAVDDWGLYFDTNGNLIKVDENGTTTQVGGGSAIEAQEDGVQLTTNTALLNWQSGLTATNPAGDDINLNVDESEVDHDSLSNFVANEHVDHSGVSISAGNAMTGGGDITASRTLNVDESSINLGNLAGTLVDAVIKTNGDDLEWQVDVNDDLILRNTTDAKSLLRIDQDSGDIEFFQITGQPTISTHDHSSGGMSTVSNAGLTNSSLTVTAGTALTGGGAVSLGGSTTLDVDESAINHDNLSGISADDHHAQDQSANYIDGGSFEIDAAEFAAGLGTAGQFLQTDGAAASWATVAFGDLSGSASLAQLSAILDANDDVEAEHLIAGNLPTHASRHSDGGSDELDVADLAGGLGTADTVPLSDGAAVSWSTVPNAGLTNDSVTVSSGNAMTGGGSPTLGGTGITLDVDESAIDIGNVAGVLIDAVIKTTGDNLEWQVDVNDDLILQNTTDATTLVTIDQDTGDITFDALTGSPSFGGHDHTSGALPTVPNSGLTNSSVTVTAGDGLKNGGAVALGGTTTLDIEPTDFAGTLLSDDGSDNLQVDESNISHDAIDQATVSADDHHAQDQSANYKDGGSFEIDVAEFAGGLGTSGQVPQSDGAAVSWVTLAAADISDVSADSAEDAHHTRGGFSRVDVSSTSATASRFESVWVDTSAAGAGVTITLPAGGNTQDGDRVRVVAEDGANTVDVSANTGQSIIGSNPTLQNAGESLEYEYKSASSTWAVIG